MAWRFQVGDQVIAAVSFRGIPQGTVGTITRADVIIDVYDVQFARHRAMALVMGSMLSPAPDARM